MNASKRDNNFSTTKFFQLAADPYRDADRAQAFKDKACDEGL